MSSDREPLPKSVVVRANKTAPHPVAESHAPPPTGDAGPSTVVEKKKKKKPTGPVAYVEGAGTPVDVDDELPDGDEYEEDDCAPAATPAAGYVDREAPLVTLAEFKRRSDLVLREFFTEGDFGEARRSYGELGAPFFGYVYVRRLLQRAMEAVADTHREKASRLLSALYGDGSLTATQVGKGFELLFETIDDVRVDVHGADTMAAKFLARAIADEVLPPAFLSDPLVQSLGGGIVDSARALLASRRAVERLEHVWGVTEAFELDDLKAAVQAAVREYFGGGGLDEAARAVRELAAPHFGHEVVLRILQRAVDSAPSEAAEAAAEALLLHLARTAQEAGKGPLISAAQVAEGFRRARERLADLSLDAPAAPAALARLAAAAVAGSILPPDVEGGAALREAASGGGGGA